MKGITSEQSNVLWATLGRYPSLEISPVSWISADLLGEPERYIPGPVPRIVHLIGGGVVLTPGLAKAITVALNLPNRSIYGHLTYERLHAEQIRTLAAARRHLDYVPRIVNVRHGIVCYRVGSPITPARIVKRWLNMNMGAYLIQASS